MEKTKTKPIKCRADGRIEADCLINQLTERVQVVGMYYVLNMSRPLLSRHCKDNSVIFLHVLFVYYRYQNDVATFRCLFSFLFDACLPCVALFLPAARLSLHHPNCPKDLQQNQPWKHETRSLQGDPPGHLADGCSIDKLRGELPLFPKTIIKKDGHWPTQIFSPVLFKGCPGCIVGQIRPRGKATMARVAIHARAETTCAPCDCAGLRIRTRRLRRTKIYLLIRREWIPIEGRKGR